MEQDSRIFISYRREDTSGYAGRIHDALSDHFGTARVFMDIESIGYGADFVEVIETAVSSCAVLIVVIGKRWSEVTDKKGNRRLDNPQDFVHLEIATALKRGIKIIPVLVQDAVMPGEDVLPEPLAKLSRRNALEISDSRWQFDIERLLRTLEQELKIAPAKKMEPAEVEDPTALYPNDSDIKREGRTGSSGSLNSYGWLKPTLIALFMLALIGLIWKMIPNSGGNSSKNSSSNTAESNAIDVKYYEGTINKREKISLRLKRQGGLLSGTMSNQTTNTHNIQIKGSIDGAQNIILQELDERGIQTGSYKGKLSLDIIEGSWVDLRGGPGIPFYLKEVR